MTPHTRPLLFHPAVWTVHTHCGPRNACALHAAKLEKLMAFLGSHTNKTPAPEGVECENCVNEMKQRNPLA